MQGINLVAEMDWAAFDNGLEINGGYNNEEESDPNLHKGEKRKGKRNGNRIAIAIARDGGTERKHVLGN